MACLNFDMCFANPYRVLCGGRRKIEFGSWLLMRENEYGALIGPAPYQEHGRREWQMEPSAPRRGVRRDRSSSRSYPMVLWVSSTQLDRSSREQSETGPFVQLDWTGLDWILVLLQGRRSWCCSRARSSRR